MANVNSNVIPSNILEGFNVLQKIYFSDEEISFLNKEFSAELKAVLQKKYNLSFNAAGDIPDESLNTEAIKVYLDKLITYAGNKLSPGKSYSFIYKLGDIAISLGELKAAYEIYSSLVFMLRKNNEDESLLAYSILALANISARQAGFDSAILQARKCIKLFESLNDNTGIAKAENLIGTIYAEQGKPRPAKNHFERGLDVLDDKGDKNSVAMFEVNLGILYNITGKFDLSYTNFQRALVKYEELKNHQRVAEVRHNLGMVHLKKLQVDNALKEFDLSLRISLEYRLLPTLAITYISKGELYTLADDLTLATAYTDKGLSVSYDINDELTIADGYKIKGIIDRKKSNFSSAENFFLSSLRINNRYENRLNYAESAFELGVLYNIQRRLPEAREYLEMAFEYFKKIGNKFETRRIKAILSELR